MGSRLPNRLFGPALLAVPAGAVSGSEGAAGLVLVDLRALLVSYSFPPVGGAGVQRVVKLAKYLPITFVTMMIGFVAIAELLIRLNDQGDDPAGGVFLGMLIAFAATVVATTMCILERTLQNAVDIKSENDLTV